MSRVGVDMEDIPQTLIAFRKRFDYKISISGWGFKGKQFT